MPAVEERVDKLEKAIADFVVSVGIEFNKLYNSQMRTEAELREFKDEMREFKDEGRQQNRDMNKKWGELANKLGTIAEDLVAPSLPRIVQEVFGLEVSSLTARTKRKLKDGRVKEYDAVAVADDYVFINSTKSSPQKRDVDELVEDIPVFREFFPEYQEKKIIGIIAGLSVDESVIQYAEGRGFLVLATGDELMDVKNTTGFKPREW